MSELVSASDLMGVKSRIAWGPVFGGFFVIVVTLLLLTTLESAIRLSFIESNKQLDGNIHYQATLLRNISGYLALFAGAWTTSRYVARETKMEAAFYGIVLWGFSFLSLLLLAINGIAWSLSYVMGINSIIESYISVSELKSMADLMSLTPEQFSLFQQMMKDRMTADTTAVESWWSFAGIVGSIAATVAGSLLGSGPRLIGSESVVVSSLAGANR